MRFLVVDGNPSEGRALGSTLVRLGHEAWVVSEVDQVPESMSVQDIDAVIAAIVTASIGGLDIAREIAARAPGLPIAFTAGTVLDPATLFHASQIGPVLPSRWNENDVERVIDEVVHRIGMAFAEGTPRPRPRKVSVSCSSWAKVEKLCRGSARICVRGRYVLSDGDQVRVALALPDEITLSVEATVIEQRNDASFIELTGLSGELSNNLLGLVRERSTGSQREPQ